MYIRCEAGNPRVLILRSALFFCFRLGFITVFLYTVYSIVKGIIFDLFARALRSGDY